MAHHPRHAQGHHADEPQKASKKRIDLTENDSNDVEAVLRFLYTVEYPYNDGISAVTDLRVYNIANRFDLNDLMQLAELRLCENVKKAWKLPEFGSLITLLYNDTLDRDDKLTEALLDVVVEHARDLYSEEVGSVGANFRRLVRSNAKFSSDINTRLMFKVQDGLVWVSCRKCKNEWAQKRLRGGSACPECGTVGHSFL